jgi:NDP-sugar pyrophosphorylase family protein
VHEPEILGTGGGVHNAWDPEPDETFVVMNGKLVFAPDLAAALALHHSRAAFATMIVKWVPDNDPTAVVQVDSAMNLRGVPGYNAPRTGPARRCMYTGVSLLSAAAHAALPERGCLIRDGYARWIEDGRCVVAHADAAPFRDVGISHAHYLEANMALASGLVRWPGIASDETGIIDPSARLGAGSNSVCSVIGANAELAPATKLERCVVWPGARVEGTHQDSVFLPDGRVLAVKSSKN